ncbi:hypothetical protein HHK36_009436 [Tetracentron sinense]|uniref:Retrotransposon Copia-like N-terminal domain-containing protein n=1 Tax=Tetracentron sinense TaxID=13715 RepID=A0A834ZBP1_TETSI|nr:hypothetical protein HHK36_009436 [Tetracentron sinense]
MGGEEEQKQQGKEESRPGSDPNPVTEAQFVLWKRQKAADHHRPPAAFRFLAQPLCYHLWPSRPVRDVLEPSRALRLLTTCIMTEPEKEVAPVAPPAFLVPQTDLSITQSTSAQRVTSVLLNGQNFYAWSRSFRLYLGGKRKTGWILGKELGRLHLIPWLNSGTWTTTRWEELAQYEPLNDFPTDATVESKRLDRRHTHLLLWMEMNANVVFFHRLRHLSCLHRFLIRWPLLLLQALVWRVTALIGNIAASLVMSLIVALISILSVIAEVASAPSILDYSQLQSQIAQLQSHLGLGPASSATISSTNPTATLAIVSLLVKNLHCAVIFLPDRCLLQDLTSKRIFGRGYECEMDSTTLEILRLPKCLWHKESPKSQPKLDCEDAVTTARKAEAARKRAEDITAGTVQMNGRELFLHEPWVFDNTHY